MRWVLFILFSGVVSAQDPLAEAVARNNAASVLAKEGRYEEAEGLYRAALDAKYDDDLTRARIAHNLAVLHQRLDRFRDAERMFRTALQLQQKSLPATSIEITSSLNSLAQIYHVEGKDWEARNLLETAVRILQEFHADDPSLPLILSNLAAVRYTRKEFDEAETLLHAALVLFEKQHRAASLEYGAALSNLGQIRETKNDLEAADLLYAQSVSILEPLGAAARLELATTLSNTGFLYGQQNRIAEAKQVEQRAFGLLRPAGDGPLRAFILRNLGNIAAAEGNVIESLPYFEQALTIQEKIGGGERPAMANLLLDYASATLRAGNKPLSRKLRKRAVELLARLNHQSTDEMTVSIDALRAAK
jgi:tetratricopeptide (TPR) repeat protein